MAACSGAATYENGGGGSKDGSALPESSTPSAPSAPIHDEPLDAGYAHDAPVPVVASKPPPAQPAAPRVDRRAGELDPDASARRPSEPAAPTTGYSGLQWTPAARELVWASPEDESPTRLHASREDLEGRHYLTSDEEHLDLFAESIRELGGAYVGVGTDQAYLFAGWMRAELVWLADYDPWVKAVHQVYLLFFEAADTPDAFIEQWRKSSIDDAIAKIRAAFGEQEGEFITHVFRKARVGVHQRLRRIRTLHGASRTPCFMTDPEIYAHVRQLALEGRVRPFVSNLFGDKALRGVADTCRELGIPVRVLYLSNAEGYWSYPEAFRENIKSLPYDDRSVVLRTRPTKPKNGDYGYSVQPARTFVAWLDQPRVKSIRHVWPFQAVRDEEHFPFSVLTEWPDGVEVNR